MLESAVVMAMASTGGRGDAAADDAWADAFAARGLLRTDEPLARHSSWRCGGVAERWFEPRNRADLLALLASAPAVEPLHWLGLGSNALVRDGGLAGTVIATTPGLSSFRWLNENRLKAEAGVPCARLAREAASRDRAGLEFMAGIPGTLGGALAMNAGALGSETWDYVECVETVDRGGRVRVRARDAFTPGYRHVNRPPGEWFLSATLVLSGTAGGEGPARIRAVLDQRNATQPTGQATCGSVFRNPPGDYAGRLIEQCGLKGFRQGGCAVSNVHANFFVNDGGASAAELEALIAHVQAVVEARTGIRLEPEVCIMGRPAENAS